MTAPPGNLADRPEPPAELPRPPCESPGPPAEEAALGLGAGPPDLLSELLRSVRLSGERIAAYAPARAFSVPFADLGRLHIVKEGELALRIDGEPHAERVRAGDFVLLPRGDAHRVGDAGERTRDEEPARWLCGTYAIGDPQASHLLASLPPVIIMHGAGGDALEGLEVARRMLEVEMRSPSQGSAVMVARILDLIFIQILRAWAAGPDAEPNWLAGAFDPQIGVALNAIHRDPAHNWTVDELARACALSRSAFADRFTTRVGRPPATYLAHVRLDSATDLLRTTHLPIATIAKTVGYTSEPAFSRAFKTRYGTPPTTMRRDTRGRGGA